MIEEQPTKKLALIYSWQFGLTILLFVNISLYIFISSFAFLVPFNKKGYYGSAHHYLVDPKA